MVGISTLSSRLSFWFGKRSKSIRICVVKWVLIVHNGFIVVFSDFCIEVVCTMRVIGLIRNFFEEVLGLVARYSRTFLVRNSELF